MLRRHSEPRSLRNRQAADLATMPQFLKYHPEARFAHYLMMAAALGEGTVTATAKAYSMYENSVGTGQIHLWFDRPDSGWRGTA